MSRMGMAVALAAVVTVAAVSATSVTAAPSKQMSGSCTYQVPMPSGTSTLGRFWLRVTGPSALIPVLCRSLNGGLHGRPWNGYVPGVRSAGWVGVDFPSVHVTLYATKKSLGSLMADMMDAQIDNDVLYRVY